MSETQFTIITGYLRAQLEQLRRIEHLLVESSKWCNYEPPQERADEEV